MATTFVDYTGDGNATKTFSFPSIKEADVKVEVDNVLKTSGNHYNITSYTTTGGGNVVFTAGNIPSNPAKIRIRRDTDVDNALATYVAGSSVKAGDLNNNQKQILYAAQEEQNVVNATSSVAGFMSHTDKAKLDGIETAATADQTASEIRTLVESASDSNVFTDADHSKLNAIEAGATADQSNAEIRAAVAAASDSNVFTDAEKTKLSNIESNATADQSNAEIKTAYEANADTNAFTDAEKTKLASVSAGAGATTFTTLSDTPANFTGAAGKTVKVNSSGNALEFVTVTVPAGNFAGLTDTPSSLTGQGGKTVKVNSGGTALEFETVATDVVDDSSPQLGGNLDVQANEITTSTTNGNIKLTPDGTGKVEVKGNGSNDGQIVLNCGNNSHGQTIKAPPHSANVSNTFTLPTTATSSLGGSGGLLRSSQAGQLSFDSTSYLQANQQIIGSSLLFTTTSQTIEFDADPNNTHHISFKSPSTYTKTSDFTLPEDGTNGQFLKTNGSGVLSFADVTSTYNIQINTLSSSSGSGGGSATFNGSATRFTLSNAGTNAQAHIVSVNGVIQKPNSGTSPSEGFAIDGNDIIFASAPASGSDFFILTLGNAISIGTPSDNTVTSAKIVDGSIVNADINASAAIAGSKLADDSITETKLDIHAAPSGTDKVLGYTANGMEWVSAAAGATGGGTDKIFYENGQTVTTNYTITNNTNAMSAGPVTINNGIAVTIGTGENWTIV